MTQFDSMHAAAVAYVARGWRIIPLHFIRPGTTRCSCDRPGCKAAGKHPIGRNWQDPAQSSQPGRWNGGASLENIGILTGSPSGFWVLDYDPADAALGDLGARLHEEGYVPHVRTGGGGYHYRFALPRDFEVRNRQSAGGGAGRTHSLPPGWDVRGEGGQVVAPPSVSAKGQYVEVCPDKDWWKPHTPPAWLLDMIRPPDHMVSTAGRIEGLPQPGGLGSGSEHGAGEGSSHPAVSVQAYATAALRAEVDAYASLTDGRRGEAAFSFGCSLVEIANLAGWPHAEVFEHYAQAMRWAAGNAGGGGYGEHEIVNQWERAKAQVGGRAREMPPPPDVLPGIALPLPPAPEPGAVDGVPTIIEPGWNGAASSGVNGVPPATATTPAPSLPPAPPPSDMRADVWSEIQRQDAREAARRWRETRDAGDVGARLTAMRAEIIDAKALKARPRLRPIVDGLFYRNTLARINGASGHGKSFIALSLAAAVAEGTGWAGRGTHAGTVVYLVAEGEEGVGGRVEAWERHHEREFPSGVLFLPRPVQVTGNEWPVLTATLAEIAPVLVIGDTQARMTVGVNEIDNTELGEVVDRLDGLRVATGACVLLLHHYGAAGERGRGGTAITGALQTEVGVKMTNTQIEVSNTKSKDDEKMRPIIFDLIQVPIPTEFGVFEPGHTSAVAVFRNEAPTTDERREDEYVKRARKVWEIMHAALGVPGQTYAEIRDALGEAIGWKGSRTGLNSAFTRAWALLIERGLVAYRKQRFKIIEVENQSADGVLTPNPDLAVGGVGVLDIAEWQLLTSGIDEKLAEERRKSKSPESS
jgi:hypothetical protein